MISESGGVSGGVDHEFVKRNLATAIHNDVLSAGAILHLNADGEAIFDRALDPVPIKTNSDLRDWRTDDWQGWADYIGTNDATFYCPSKDSATVTQARNSAIPTAAANNQIDVVNNDTMPTNLTVVEISDDINGTTDWDCVFTINGSVNITRTMPIPVDQQSDSFTFNNYSYFRTGSQDSAWIIGTKTYFFASFVYYNSTMASYNNRLCIIEFTTADPADGNIRYFDYLAGAAEVDRAWKFQSSSEPTDWNYQYYTLGNINQFDPSIGVYHDTSTNIMYVLGCPTTGNGIPTSTTGFVHYAILSVDLDDATSLTTCCDEDMSVARFMLNGEIYTFTPPESANHVGYTSSGTIRNYREYVGCGAQQVITDVATGKEYLFWACKWYETSNNSRHHYGILEIDRTGKTGVVKDHIQATGTNSTGAINICRIYDTTSNDDTLESVNIGGYVSVEKIDGHLIFFMAGTTSNVDFKRNIASVISYDITGDTLYTKATDPTYGVSIGTTGSETVTDTAATVADDVVTYKFAHGAVTYEFDITMDGLEIWGDATERPEVNATYTDIYFDTVTLMYYNDNAGERIAPAALCVYVAGIDSPYHRQLGFIKYTVGTANSVTWHPTSPWITTSYTSFSEISETSWSLLTPDVWLMPALNESTYYAGQFNQSGANEFGRCGAYIEGAFDFDPRNDGTNPQDYLQLHIVEPKVWLIYDAIADESYSSFPVTPLLRTVLLDAAPLTPVTDYWGKRLSLSRIGHFAWVLHDDPDTARDHYAWNVMFSGPHIHADNSAVNGRERCFYAHGLLPNCHDDTYTYLGANIMNRRPTATSSLDWQIWRLNRTTFTLERWPDSFFDSGHSSVHCFFTSGVTTYADPDYDSWVVGNNWGMSTNPAASNQIFPFRTMTSEYVIAGGYQTANFSWTPSWKYYWNIYSLVTGEPIGIVINPMSSGLSPNMAKWNATAFKGALFPGSVNGGTIDGFQLWNYIEGFGLGQMTAAIGKALGVTVNSNTPVIFTDNGTSLQSDIEESHANYVVVPANDVLGEKYYELNINDRMGVTSDILNLPRANKPYRARYYSTSITTGNTVTVSLDQAVFDKEKASIIVISATQNLDTYPLFWSFNVAGDEINLRHTYSATMTFYYIVCEWE